MSGHISAASFERIEDVPAETWDTLAPPDFFFQRGFLDVMARSGVEDARYRYLLLTDGGSGVGVAVLSSFTLKLDLLAGDPWVTRLRRLLPSLLDVPIVCCGVPASFGQHHLHVADPRRIGDAFERVHREMEAWAEDEGCGLLVWKEWPAGGRMCDSARTAGYVVVPTLPDHVVDPLPTTVDEFLSRLRSDYRRKFRAAARLMDGDGPLWTDGGTRLEEHAFGSADVDGFHRGYMSVMDRTPVRMETYPRTFFERLARSDVGATALRIVSGRSGDSISALLVPGGATLWFVLVAKERSRYDDALYTLILQCIVLYAIRRGFRSLRLGQTSSYAKCSVGASGRPLEAFLAMRGPVKHAVLKALGPRLFPLVEAADLRVYKRETTHPTFAEDRK